MGDVCLIAESMEENGWCPGGQMPGSVIAWDLVRVVNLARWSYLCGYLNEDEMWQVMQLAADTALEHFSSWEEYGASFVIVSLPEGIFMSDFGKVLVYLLLKFMKGSAVYILACMILLNLTATRTSAREGEQISPLYFGPNALPVPDMLDGRVSERFYLELDYDCHSGFYGDLTQTVFAKANIPLFSPRVNLSLWMPVVEFYRNTPASIEHSRPPEVSYRGWQIGNVYVSVDIQVLKERRFLPDMTVRAAIVTASGDGDEYLRNYDAPGYFFDASIGKSVKFQDGFFQSLRLAVNAGFLCWQVSANTQNDAYMYGVKTVLETRLLDVSCAWQGYTGWIGDGDAPMVIKATAVFHAGRFRPLIAYEYGLRDYPFHHFRVGVGFVFGQAEALIRIRER